MSLSRLSHPNRIPQDVAVWPGLNRKILRFKNGSERVIRKMLRIEDGRSGTSCGSKMKNGLPDIVKSFESRILRKKVEEGGGGYCEGTGNRAHGTVSQYRPRQCAKRRKKDAERQPRSQDVLIPKSKSQHIVVKNVKNPPKTDLSPVVTALPATSVAP
jgi:hypothetical protein